MTQEPAFVAHEQNYDDTEKLIPFYRKILNEHGCSGVVLSFGTCVLVNPKEKSTSTFSGWNKDKRWKEVKHRYREKAHFKAEERNNAKEVKRIFGKYSPYDDYNKACIAEAFNYLQKADYPLPGGICGDRTVSEMDTDLHVFIAEWSSYSSMFGLCMFEEYAHQKRNLNSSAACILGDLFRFDWILPAVATVLHPDKKKNSGSVSKKRINSEPVTNRVCTKRKSPDRSLLDNSTKINTKK